MKAQIEVGDKGYFVVHGGQRRYGKMLECEHCGKEHFVRNSAIAQGKGQYCSNRCAKLARPTKMFGDDNPMSKRTGEKNPMYDRTGEDSSNWKGGQPMNRLIKNLSIYKKCTEEVLLRDENKCQDCGATGVKLEVHHIKPAKQIIEENNIKSTDDARKCDELWDKTNLISLCVQCHNTRHKEMRT